MDYLNRRDLSELLRQSGSGPCISIYLPTHRGSGEPTREDEVRFKNLVKAARRQLARVERLSPVNLRLIAGLETLASEQLFWKHQSEGLAVFYSPSVQKTWRLPVVFEESVSVDKAFHVGPLLQFLALDLTYYLLALSQNQVRLFKGSRHKLQQVRLGELPTSVADTVWYKQTERELQNRNAGAGSVHGQGEDTRAPNPDLWEFLRRVDAVIKSYLRESQAPLVVYASSPTLDYYRKISSYRYLFQESLEGNPDNMAAERLHQVAWPVVERLAYQPIEEAVQLFRRLAAANPERVSVDLPEILQAARSGRIQTMLVSYGPAEPAVAVFGEARSQGSGGEDVSDLAVREALLRGSLVYPVERSDFPARSKVVAILRY